MGAMSMKMDRPRVSRQLLLAGILIPFVVLSMMIENRYYFRASDGGESDPRPRMAVVAKKPSVHVLFGLSGSNPEFLAEFQAALKSVLLNSPLDSDLDIHLITDGEAYEAMDDVFQSTGLEGSVWRNKISIHTYDADPYVTNWAKTMEASTPWALDDVAKRHTIGNLFGIFAYQVLPDTVEHVLYMDTDVVIMANLADLWQYVDQNKTFQWGRDRCAGFMIYNMKKFASFWDLVSRCNLQEYQEKHKRYFVGDQIILRAVKDTFPQVVGTLPKKWSISASDGARGHEHDIVDFRPSVGMLHFNGGGESKDAFYKKHPFVTNNPETWGTVTYYADLPWPWALYMGQSMTGNREGQRLVIRHGGEGKMMSSTE